MYTHAKLRAFDRRLSALFHEVDHRLEGLWGDVFPLHPNRPSRGATANPEMDGLFEVVADFSPGLGSRLGRGYLVNLRVATLSRVPPERKEAFMSESAETIRELLPFYFPERALRVAREGSHFKIVGDFSLGFA